MRDEIACNKTIWCRFRRLSASQANYLFINLLYGKAYTFFLFVNLFTVHFVWAGAGESVAMAMLFLLLLILCISFPHSMRDVVWMLQMRAQTHANEYTKRTTETDKDRWNQRTTECTGYRGANATDTEQDIM